jgi:ribonuclease VapC
MLDSPAFSHTFDDFMRESGIAVEPVDFEQVQIARGAYRAYGEGTTHSARLNFEDCFAYALAKLAAEPLLFKGKDFAQTDLIPAIPGEGPQESSSSAATLSGGDSTD